MRLWKIWQSLLAVPLAVLAIANDVAPEEGPTGDPDVVWSDNWILASRG